MQESGQKLQRPILQKSTHGVRPKMAESKPDRHGRFPTDDFRLACSP